MLETGRVHIGDARELAGQLAPGSINTIVTSPPYFGLRSYLPADHPDKVREMGSEATPDEFVAQLVALFAALRSALRDDGTVWLNLGDSYAGNQGGAQGQTGQRATRTFTASHRVDRRGPGLKDKDLCGIPWLVAFALRADGWYLRSDCIWAKANPMPESVRDRPTRAHEYLFLLSKSPRYFYDADAIMEPVTGGTHPKGHKNTPPKSLVHADSREKVKNNASFTAAIPDVVTSRNKRSVWNVNPAAFPDAHFATFPPDLVRPCIRAGTSERGCCAACGAPWRRVVERTPMVIARSGRGAAMGEYGRTASSGTMVEPPISKTTGWEPTCRCGASVVPCTVLDPFAGSGTVAEVCVEEGRNWIGFDLDERSIGWHDGRLRALPVRSLFVAD